MIQIIVNAFVEESKETAVVEVLFASADHEKVKAKYQELKTAKIGRASCRERV